MRVFVSCQDVDAATPQRLIERLRAEGWRVDHSPKNPIRGDQDPRWYDWYAQGLGQALAASDVFVIVVDFGWDSSTWMGEEAHLAIERRAVPKAHYWNPDSVDVPAAGMLRYLVQELPMDLDQLVKVLKQEHETRESIRAKTAT